MAKRSVINIPGLSHKTPIPMGARIGNMVFSSAISGRDPETQILSPDPDRQAEMLFRNIRKFMELAGGSLADIGHMTVFLKDIAQRAHIDKQWVQAFPDKDDRPARHAVTSDLRGEVLFQVELIAVL